MLLKSEDINFYLKQIPYMNYFSGLLEGMGISHFHYFRIYRDGSYIHLVDHKRYAQFYFSNMKETSNIFVDMYRRGKTDYLWPPHSHKKDFQIIKAAEFDIANGLTITKTNKEFSESWTFATALENTNISSVYLSNLSTLKTFIDYFNNKASYIIDEAHNYKGKLNLGFNWDKAFETQKSIEPFFPYVVNGKDVNLSKREEQCIEMLGKGFSQKLIAVELEISHRTVETFINNIKLKLEVTNTQSLLKIYHRHWGTFLQKS